MVLLDVELSIVHHRWVIGMPHLNRDQVPPTALVHAYSHVTVIVTCFLATLLREARGRII
jgi:hypothetical protein